MRLTTLFILLITAVLVFVVSKMSDVVPAAWFAYGRSNDLALRVMWWIWPVLYWAMLLHHLPRHRASRSFMSYSAWIGLLIIARVLIQWPIICVLKSDNAILLVLDKNPTGFQFNTQLLWALSSSGVTLSVSILTLLASLVCIIAIWWFSRYYTSLRSITLFLIIIVNVLVHQLATMMLSLGLVGLTALAAFPISAFLFRILEEPNDFQPLEW
ncbi:MAG: hypothetical protein ABFD64_01405 [Armatimonadota bacterium]